MTSVAMLFPNSLAPKVKGECLFRVILKWSSTLLDLNAKVNFNLYYLYVNSPLNKVYNSVESNPNVPDDSRSVLGIT